MGQTTSLETLVAKTSHPKMDSQGRLNIENAENLVDRKSFLLIVERLTSNRDVERLKQVADGRNELMRQLTEHQRCILLNRPTPSQRLAQQGKLHWTDEQVNRLIQLGSTAETDRSPSQAQQKQNNSGYHNANTNTVKAATAGDQQIGDIGFNTEKGGGYLYPHCAGQYYEPVEPITFHEMNELVKEVKNALREAMLTHTNKETLTSNMEDSINEINVTNVVGFLMGDSIGDFIDVLPTMQQQWLYLQSIPSFDNFGNYALVWSPTVTDFTELEIKIMAFAKFMVLF